MRISQIAERSGVPATTLRFYESAGLLPADRTPAGYRLYGESAVERLAFISAAKHLGLPLEEIGELLTVWEAGACQEVKADLRPRIIARLEEAGQRSAELASFTASLHTALKDLDALPDRTSRCDPDCGFLNPPPPTAQVAGPVNVEIATSRQAAEQDTEPWRTAPVACSLTDDAVTERTTQWHTVLHGARRAEIPDGLRLSLPADRAAQVVGLAVAEQQCCSFFDFRLQLDGPALHLEVRAPADAASMLADLFGPIA